MRRKEYDGLYSTRSRADKTEEPGASTNFFSTFANMFAGGAAGATPPEQPDADNMFANVFDEVSLKASCQTSMRKVYPYSHSFYARKSRGMRLGGPGLVLYAAPA